MKTLFPRTMCTLRERLSDRRGNRVLFLSHCLLNANTRYMGGAFAKGVNPEILRLLVARTDCGVIQMICPERVAWGGIYKKHVYQFHGMGRCKIVHAVFAFLMPLYLFVLNWRMRWVARYTAREIADYLREGMNVVGIVGIRGSPTCAVTSHPDLREYFEWSSKVEIDKVTADEQNEVLRKVSRPGPGIFIGFLSRQLNRRRIKVPFYEFDLFDEMDGKPNRLLPELEGKLTSSKGAR